MAVCLVCSRNIEAEQQVCEQCGTSSTDLAKMRHLAGKVRFLFGEGLPEVLDTPVPKKAEKKPAVKSKTAAKKTKPAPKKPTVTQQPLADPDLVLQRDVSVSRPSKVPKRPVSRHVLAYGIDVVLCLILNFWIVKFIQALSPRSLEELVTFSLIPVVFVLLSFSFLYFWLFFNVFKKTLGCLIVERLFERSKS